MLGWNSFHIILYIIYNNFWKSDCNLVERDVMLIRHVTRDDLMRLWALWCMLLQLWRFMFYFMIITITYVMCIFGLVAFMAQQAWLGCDSFSSWKGIGIYLVLTTGTWMRLSLNPFLNIHVMMYLSVAGKFTHRYSKAVCIYIPFRLHFFFSVCLFSYLTVIVIE